MSRLAHSAIAFFALTFVLLVSSLASAQCRLGNLLEGKAPLSSRGVERVERLTDGWLTLEGFQADAFDAARLKGLRPFVEWDLGALTPIVAAAVQADNNDVYRLSVSLDGKEFTPLWTLDRVDQPGLRERVTRDLEGTARFVRLEASGGDHVFSVAEVRVFCQVPDPWPPLRVVRRAYNIDPVGMRLGQIQTFKLVLGLAGIALLIFGFPRMKERAKKASCWAIIVLATLGWVHFGYFHGHVQVHSWDAFHYFMGSKYFPELGYFEFYRCGAKAEREAGRDAELDRLSIRDLDDNRVYPGHWTRTYEGRCRAVFSPERWAAFKADIEGFRKLFTDRPVANAFVDHGFNATPVNAAWLRLWTNRVQASPNAIAWLARMDWVALAGALAFAYWGFGALGCAIAALVIGIGYPWNYHWVGGGLGRHTWVLCSWAGFALLKREKTMAGMAVLTTAGLLRFFPFLFVGAAGLWAVIRWAKTRKLDRAGRHVFAGVALALAIGLPLGGVTSGIRVYPEFVRDMQRHATTPLANHMGLPFLLGYRSGQLSEELKDPKLTDPYEIWTAQHMLNRQERKPLWILGILLSLGLIAYGVLRGANVWQTACLAGPLIFSALPSTSYDYIWLSLLVPIALDKPRRCVYLVAFAMWAQAMALLQPDIEVQHIWDSLGCLVLLVALAWDVIKELTARAGTSAAAT